MMPLARGSNKHLNLPTEVPGMYEELVRLYPLRKIHDQYENPPAKADKAAHPLEMLRYLVEENGITTRELGKILGVDHSVAARILTGHRSVTKSVEGGVRYSVAPASRELGISAVVLSLRLRSRKRAFPVGNDSTRAW